MHQKSGKKRNKEMKSFNFFYLDEKSFLPISQIKSLEKRFNSQAKKVSHVFKNFLLKVYFDICSVSIGIVLLVLINIFWKFLVLI